MTATTANEPAKAPRTFMADFLASIVVFMVALPLCIGIAQACGLPPGTGVVTGVVGGIIVGMLAGSPLQVSGPAAGLIVLVIDFIDDAKAPFLQQGATDKEALAHAVALLGIVILLAGMVQIIAGLLRMGQWFRAVSPAVVEGMLAGIGLTIISKQFHVLVDDTPPKNVIEGLLTIPSAIMKGFQPDANAGINHREAALIGVVALLVLAGWKLLKPKALKFIPSAVVAVLCGVVINEFGRPVIEFFGWPVGPVVDDHGGLGVEKVAISANLLDSLTLFQWPGWEVLGSALIWKGVIAFALIASAESLLCAVAVDTMNTGPRTKFDRELVAQGVGNTICGLLGALPMTGVIVRSTANVDAGAKTRLSTILHGIWLLLFVSLFPGLLSRIPLAALAAVLVYTGWKLLNLPGLVHLWKQSRLDAMIFIITAGTIVATDLLNGVVVGILISAAALLWQFSYLTIRREDEPGRIHLHLDGAGTFVRLPVIANELDRLPPRHAVFIHLDDLRLVDHAVLTMLMTFRKQYESSGGQVHLDWDNLRSRFYTPQLSNTKPGYKESNSELAAEIQRNNAKSD